MKLRLLNIIVFSTLFYVQALAGLKEPKSDPAFNQPSPTPVEEESTEITIKDSPPAEPEEENINDDTLPKRLIQNPDSTPSTFSVKTTKLTPSKPVSPKFISLLTPRHNSVYTPGIITFSWKVNSLKKGKKTSVVILRVERVDGKRKFARKTRKEKKLLDMSPGEYRWQVVTGKKGQESRWRLFKIQDPKSHSLTDLYNGAYKSKKPKKPLPEVSEYIREVEPEEDVDDLDNVQWAEDPEPLPIPDSLKRDPAAEPQAKPNP